MEKVDAALVSPTLELPATSITSLVVSTQRDIAIDSLKGIAIIGVLVIHANFDRFGSDTREWIERGALWLQWSVPAFFFAAGVVARHPNTYAELHAFVQRRALRLLVPFVAFAAFYRVALSAIGKADLYDFTYVGAPQLYFLAYLFGISCVVAGFTTLGERKPLLFAFVIAIVASMILAPAIPTHGPSPELICLYAVSYIGGVYASQHSLMHSTVALLAGGLAISLLSQSVHPFAIAVPPLVYLVLRYFRNSKFASALAWLGVLSAAIFVWHTPLVMPIASIMSVHAFGGGVVAFAATMVLTVVTSFVLGFVSQKIPFKHPFQI